MVSFKTVMAYLVLIPAFLAVHINAAGCPGGPGGTCPNTVTTSTLTLPPGFVILSNNPLCPGAAPCSPPVNCPAIGGCTSAQLTPSCTTGSASCVASAGLTCPGPTCGNGNPLCVNSGAATCAGSPTCGSPTCGSSDTATCIKSGTSVTCPACPGATPAAVCPSAVAITTATVRIFACCCTTTTGGGSNSFCATVVNVTIAGNSVTTSNTCLAAGGTCG